MSTEAGLVAVVLPPPEAAAVAIACWEPDDAVLPLDPATPKDGVRRIIDRFRPTALVDQDGRRGLSGGVPVTGGVAAVVATAGTSADPKGVELTFDGLRASAEVVEAAVGEGRRWLCCLPVHYVAGLAVVGRAWVSGIHCDVLDGFDIDKVELVAETQKPNVSLVPVMLSRLLAARVAIERFHHILLGGGPIPPSLRARAEQAKGRVSATYGMTETWGGIIHDGRPLPGVEVRIADDGEILVRTPTLMQGYRLDPDGTAAAVDPEGWFHTRDVGEWADDGRLRVVERLDDLVNTGGIKVSPTEVERVLADHPGVADAAVAGRPDPEWGQRVVAFVVPADPGQPPSLDDLRAFVSDRLTGPKAPREVVLVETIPRSPAGKLARRHLPG
jgi:O-succinylbenzoic acid--CoA ligase